MYAHVLRKSAFNEFRLYPNNIVLLSPNYKGYSIHHLFDNGSLDEILKFERAFGKSFEMLFEFEELVYNEYKREFGAKAPMRKIVEVYKSQRL